MDEMRISSKVTKLFVAKIISKLIKAKLGYDVSLVFPDDISLKIDDDGAHVHLNVKIDMSGLAFSKVKEALLKRL